MQTILLNRVAGIEQLQGIDPGHLQVSVKKPIVIQEMIPVRHRTDPAIWKQPTENTKAEFEQRETLLPRQRVKIFSYDRLSCDRSPGVSIREITQNPRQ